MESPPSSSSWSPQPLILSDDSGLLLTTGSFSSGNTSFERKHNIFEDSDCEEKSLSQDESLDGMSDIICGQNFNTLKKGPNWIEIKQQTIYSPIEPPLEFQDQPLEDESFTPPSIVDFFCDRLTHQILKKVMLDFRDRCFGRSNIFHQEKHPISPPPLPSRLIIMDQQKPSIHRPLAELARFISSPHRSHSISYPSPTANFPFLTSHTPRPSSRSSLGGGSSRLSSSHNSLCIASTRKVDDSSFITQAVSHDTLSSNQISDLYNVPFDSDVYAVPVDVVKTKPKKSTVYSCHLLNKKRRNDAKQRSGRKSTTRSEQPNWSYHQCETKRHSVAGTSANNTTEPIHMTLKEVRTYLQTLYSSSSDSSEAKELSNKNKRKELDIFVSHNNNNKFQSSKDVRNNQILTRPKKSTFLINIKNKKVKDSCGDNNNAHHSVTISPVKTTKDTKKRRIFNFKQTLCNIFRFRRFLSMEEKTEKNETDLKMQYELNNKSNDELNNSLSSRALPPLPNKIEENNVEPVDFATSIQRVKDYGWYWGPLSSESAEKILSNEPDGSFIVRDSSDDHYIFSLTFKLNNSVRHVRIEHFQGNFSFGSCTKFKSQTIVEFIENAVEHSRSGRYLFFLHRRPVIGPVRVQLLHPISRFKQVQSLQHMCRFIIHKNVRRDLIPQLPLPRRMIDYINTPHYYSERFFDLLSPETINNNNNNNNANNNDQTSSDEGSFGRSFVPPMIFPNENRPLVANEYIVLNSHINQENVNSNDD